MLQAYMVGLKNIFKLKWRMSKYDFCSFLTVHFFVCLLVFAGLYFLKISIFFFLLLILLTIIPYLAIGHRLQDVGKSGFMLISYIFAFLLCYGICGIIAGYSAKFIYPLEHHAPLMSVLPYRLSYTVRCSQYLAFGVFLFFVYRWFFGDEDKETNTFGKPIKQTKVSKWFILLPLLFVTYIIVFPWISYIKAITNYVA